VDGKVVMRLEGAGDSLKIDRRIKEVMWGAINKLQSGNKLGDEEIDELRKALKIYSLLMPGKLKRELGFLTGETLREVKEEFLSCLR